MALYLEDTGPVEDQPSFEDPLGLYDDIQHFTHTIDYLDLATDITATNSSLER